MLLREIIQSEENLKQDANISKSENKNIKYG